MTGRKFMFHDASGVRGPYTAEPHRGRAKDLAQAEADLERAREDIARLREQNKAHAERRDQEVADLQKRVARYDHLFAEARRRMEHAAVDWTTDPPSKRPGGWWRYTSINHVYEVTVLVADLERAREALSDLLNWAENIEGEGRLRRTEALQRARDVLADVSDDQEKERP